MCSVIGLHRPDQVVLGASYDFYYGHGLAVTNKRGLDKVGLGEQPPLARWQSRYGSVTFNQFGRELPTCGMNEAGLAIHLLEIKGAGYPPVPAERPRLNELQWIQYQLDRHATVPQVLEHLEEVAIEPVFFDLHYALCDARGNLGLVEFVDGRCVTRLDCPVVTNHPYQESLDHLQRHRHKGRPVPKGNGSLERFVRLTHWAEQDQPAREPVEYAFEALGSVFRRPGLGGLLRWLLLRQPPATSFWNTVFEPAAGRIHFRTADHRPVRRLDLAGVDFDPASPVRVLDLTEKRQGNITDHLRPYCREDNARIVYKSYRPVAHKVPAAAQEQLIDYPDGFRVSGQTEAQPSPST